MNVLIAEDDAIMRLVLQRSGFRPIAGPVRAANACYQIHRTPMRAGGQGHALLVATRARVCIAFPCGIHAGVPCEVLLWG